MAAGTGSLLELYGSPVEEIGEGTYEKFTYYGFEQYSLF